MAISRRVMGAMMLSAGVAGLALTIKQGPQILAQRAADARAKAEYERALADYERAKTGKPGAAASSVVALWTGKPIPGEPLGVHVADVGVDASGAVSLLLADNAATKAAVEAALAEARAQPALAVPVSTSAAPGQAPAQARPGEPRYVEAVAQFLAAKTGFKPQLQGR